MNSEIQNIKNGDRHPVENVDDVIVKLTTLAAQHKNPDVTIHWTLAHDAVGPCLHAKIKFTHPKDCLEFAQYVHDLQEKADHHSHFVMENFHTVNIMLSTHHPVPAITTVDVLFARTVMLHAQKKASISQSH